MKFEEAYEIEPMLPKTSLRKSLTTFRFSADFHLEGDLRPCFLGGFGAVFHPNEFLSAYLSGDLARITKECGIATGGCWVVPGGIARRVSCIQRAVLWPLWD